MSLALLLAAPGASAQGKKRGPKPGGIGLLEISSMTDGANVFVDGQPVGTLPLRAPVRLTEGKHTIKVIKRGYSEYLDVFSVARNETTTLDIDLLPYAGVFVITSIVPDARVFIDGKYVGNAPIETEVLIGERSLRVRKPGYYDYIKTLSATAGQEVKINVDLKPMPIGTTPYRPPPPPPPNWYEKWYVWVGAAGGVAAVAAAIIVPVVLLSKSPLDDFNPEITSGTLTVP